MKPCPCKAADPTANKPYLVAYRIAKYMNAAGLRQVKCPNCHLFTVWTDKKTT